jgi:hypothetical protein
VFGYLLLLLTLFLRAGEATAQIRSERVLVTVHERYERAPVSRSGIVVGLASAQSERPFGTEFFVVVPNGGGLVCIAIISINGFYRAFGEHRALAGGLHAFRYQTRYASELRRYRWQDMALLVSLGDTDCTGLGTLRIMPAFEEASGSGDLTLKLLTGGNSQSVTIGTTTMSCQRPAARGRFAESAFDAECPIMRSQVSPVATMSVQLRDPLRNPIGSGETVEVHAP